MKKVNLTKYKMEESSLQDLELGQYVEHEDEGAGVIAAFIEKDTEWFPKPSDDDSAVEIEASEGSPVYIVALIKGGSIPAEPSEIEPIEGLPGDGEEPSTPADFRKAKDETKLAEVYSMVDNPDSLDELEEAKRELIYERYASELGEYVDNGQMELEDLERLSYEELINIPGVDDPEVGFDELPNGWTRKSVIEAWVTVGATWRSCRARMLRHFGNRMAKKFCAVLKDELLGTERWRNRF